jgi:hypothetical protein
MKLMALPEIVAAKQSDVLTCPPIVVQILVVESLIVVGGLTAALFFQTRKRDLI